MALQLSLVARLEEFERSRLEYSGDLQVIQYRGQILPLVFLSEVLTKLRRPTQTIQKRGDDTALHVVVYTENGHSVGLVVEQILDIVETDINLEIQNSTKRNGVAGSIVLQGVVTELLDLRNVIQQKIPSFLSQQAEKTLLVGMK